MAVGICGFVFAWASPCNPPETVEPLAHAPQATPTSRRQPCGCRAWFSGLRARRLDNSSTLYSPPLACCVSAAGGPSRATSHHLRRSRRDGAEAVPPRAAAFAAHGGRCGAMGGQLSAAAWPPMQLPPLPPPACRRRALAWRQVPPTPPLLHLLSLLPLFRRWPLPLLPLPCLAAALVAMAVVGCLRLLLPRLCLQPPRPQRPHRARLGAKLSPPARRRPASAQRLRRQL